MMPVLFSISSLHIYSLSIFIILSWMVFSFIFWRTLRNQGISEEYIFNLTFYSTIAAAVGSRIGYVLTHWATFSDQLLRIGAVWISPGLTLYGALIPALLVMLFFSRRNKVRVGFVLDAFAPAFGGAYILGALGAFFDGSYVGTQTTLPWAISYIGHQGSRHPIQIYEIIFVILILTVIVFLSHKAKVKKWPYGVLGLWFFALYAPIMFVLEFVKESSIYLGYLRANQWILVALYAETLGAFYVRGGGRQFVRPIINKIIGGIHGKFSKRSTRTN